MTKEQVFWKSVKWISVWTLAYLCLGTLILPHRWCLWLTLVYFCTLVTFSLGVIPPGYYGEYTLRKKRRLPEWEEGYFMIPPFIPVFVFTNGWFVGVRKITPSNQMKQVRSDFFERIHHDTRDVRRVVNSNVSLSENILFGFFQWLLEKMSHGGDEGKLRFLPFPFLILIWTSYFGTTISYAITPREETFALWIRISQWFGV